MAGDFNFIVTHACHSLGSQQRAYPLGDILPKTNIEPRTPMMTLTMETYPFLNIYRTLHQRVS